MYWLQVNAELEFSWWQTNKKSRSWPDTEHSYRMQYQAFQAYVSLDTEAVLSIVTSFIIKIGLIPTNLQVKKNYTVLLF